MGRVLIFSLLAAVAGGWLAYRKGRSPFLWATLCFLFPLTLVVVAFLPPAPAPGRTCSRCGRPLGPDASACPVCGRSSAIELVECPRCHTMVPRERHCAQCGAVL